MQVAATPPGEQACNWHPEQDADGEPFGEECRRPATHVILWTWPDSGERRWSFGCADHIDPPGIDPSGAHGWLYEAIPVPRRW